MKLYRARPLSERPARQRIALSNEPKRRIRGRWYTSKLTNAAAHGEMLGVGNDWEIVMVDIDDAMADAFCVATTPMTRCGLNPGAYSQTPESDYVLPVWLTRTAITIAVAGSRRQRDVIDIGRPYNVITVDFSSVPDETALPVAI